MKINRLKMPKGKKLNLKLNLKKNKMARMKRKKTKHIPIYMWIWQTVPI